MSKPPTPTIALLANRSVRIGTGCVLYTGYADKQGYTRIWDAVAQEKRLAHRVSYELYIGPIPEGMQIDHLCGVRNCVNPEHLEAVTPLENTRRSSSATKTHCVNGHEFTPENTRLHTRPGSGWPHRICRRCDANRAAQARRRRAAA